MSDVCLSVTSLSFKSWA